MSTDAEPKFEPYENTLSIETLRREIRREWDDRHDLTRALRDLPEVPPSNVLIHLGEGGASNNLSDEIKGEVRRMQMSPEHRGKIPFKAECEWGMAVWIAMRRGLLAGRTASGTAS